MVDSAVKKVEDFGDWVGGFARSSYALLSDTVSGSVSQYLDLTKLLMAVAITAVGLAQDVPTNDAPAVGSLAWHARKARSEGKSSVTLGPTIELYAEGESLDEAIQHDTVVIATLLQSETVHDERTICTWRKYRTDELLAKQSLVFPQDRDKDLQKLVATAPKTMLPLHPGEFLMYEVGGVATINGVKITKPGTGTEILAPGSRYLMFLILGASGTLAGGAYGPSSLFSVDAADMLQTRMPTLVSDRNVLLREIRSRTGGSISAFRSLVACRSKPVC